MSGVEISEFEKLKEELPGYLARAKSARSQPTKEFIFASFVQKVFGITPEDFSEKMEVPVVSKVLLVRGRIDAVFGNLLFEFKVDLDRELDNAKEEFTKYFQALREKHPTTSYIGVATDDIKFRVFKPTFDKKGKIQRVIEIDSLNLEQEKSQPEKVYLWFDSYLFISEKIPPTTEDLRKRFGVESPTFAFMKDELARMLELLEDPTVKTKVENWEKYLEIVYGDKLTSSDLFIKHTYLATLAKIIVYLHLYEGKIPAKEEVNTILNGEAFEKYGIVNFIEEDFFAWILHPQIEGEIDDLVMKLLRELIVYDFTQLNEDVFKELYQELVDPEVRHDLGEYYTPDWIAEYMLKDLVVQKPDCSVLDPACGSGTFLFSTIKLVMRELKANGKKPKEILEHILDNIMGVDIHPLAVIISRTNYLLALDELVDYKTRPITIPVYLSDSMRLPEFASEVQYNIDVYKVSADKSFFAIPHRLADEPSLIDEVISKMYEYAKVYEKKEQSEDDTIKAFSQEVSSMKNVDAKELKIFARDLKILLDLIDKGKNTIWSFILRNIYKPVALSHRKFDYVVGNPPWLSMRYMKNPQYQEFLKAESGEYKLVDKESTHLFTHMEMASLFFCKSADIYLAPGGTIAFVMPKSVLVASQHVNFRRFEKPKMKLFKVLDFEDVSPVFNVPACALIAKKEAKK
jgi:hypothetical protein